MKSARKLGLYKELLWWFITIIITTIVIVPLIGKLQFAYYQFIILTCILFITFFRYNVFFNQIHYLKYKWLRKLLLAMNPFIFVSVLFQMQEYFNMLDDYDIDRFLNPSFTDSIGMYDKFIYYKRVLILSSIGTLVMSVVFELRVLRSIFLQAPQGKEKIIFQQDPPEDDI